MVLFLVNVDAAFPRDTWFVFLVVDCVVMYDITLSLGWGLAAGYQPRPQLVDRGTTTRYGGQLRYEWVSSPDT